MFNHIIKYQKEIEKELIQVHNYKSVAKDIIIVVKDQLDYVKTCIDSIEKNTTDYNLFVWDNGSNEETRNWLIQQSFNYYRSEVNKGFIEPNNILASYGKSPFLIFLNSDTVVLPDWDKLMIVSLQNEVFQVGYSGGMLDENFHGKGQAFGYTADYIEGWCFAVSRKIYETYGLFDANLEFAYGEDADLSLRLKSFGGKVYALYSGLVLHVGQRTIATVSKERRCDESFEKNHKYLQEKWSAHFNKRP